MLKFKKTNFNIISIDNYSTCKKNNQINFTGYGVYGLGYDSWFQSNLFFDINLDNDS